MTFPEREVQSIEEIVMRFSLHMALASAILAVVVGSRAGGQEDQAADHYRAALAAEARRDFKTALSEYEKVIDIDSEHADALNRWETCEKLAAWQAALGGKTPAAADLVRLGEIYCGARRIKEERRAYGEAIALDPHCHDAHGHLAMSHYTSGGGSMITVVRETRKFLETSPHRNHLDRAIADWEVFGELRIFSQVLGEDLKAAQKATAQGRALEAAAILEAAAGRPMPSAYRTTLCTRAGKLRAEAGDKEGARKCFTSALKQAPCRATIGARLGLAALDVEMGDQESALAHLRAAVAEGSYACQLIEADRGHAFRPLFTSEKAELKAEVENLADAEYGDRPIREMIGGAVARAKQEGKKVLLEWYGPYCPYVMALEDRLQDPRIRKIIADRFVFIRMNQGSLHRGMTMDREYGDVMRKYGVPCFFVLDADGHVDTIQRDAELMSVPHRAFSVDKIAAWLQTVAKQEP